MRRLRAAAGVMPRIIPLRQLAKLCGAGKVDLTALLSPLQSELLRACDAGAAAYVEAGAVIRPRTTALVASRTMTMTSSAPIEARPEADVRVASDSVAASFRARHV